MKTRITVLSLLVAVAVTAVPLGTEFTYQGVLSDAGSPASGLFDFRFFLYNADAGGSQVGPVVLIEDLTVTDGRFTTQIDFGSVFDGTALWLEVGVRDGALTGAYTVLSPRQELTAAPFAQHAQSAVTAATASTAGHATTADSATTAGHATTAGSATTAGDSDLLDGMDGSYYLTWSNFVGIPSDLADGDDDTLADLSCGSDEIARWTGSAWNCSSDDDTPYARTYVVGPVGTPTENGTALLSAVAAITPPTSQEEAVLLVLEPGVFDLDAGNLYFTSWTTIEGAGENRTLITSAACGGSATIHTWYSSHIDFRHLTIENTCSSGSLNACAFRSSGSDVAVHQVAFLTNGAAVENSAVIYHGSDLRMSDVRLKAENGIESNIGLKAGSSSVNLNVARATVEAVGGTIQALAVESRGDDLTVKDSTMRASGSSGQSVAFYQESGSGFSLHDVTADGGLGPDDTVGVFLIAASGTLRDVRATGRVAVEVWTTSGTRNIEVRNLEAKGFDQAVVCDAGSSEMHLDINDSWMLGGTGVGVINVPGSPDCTITIRGSYVNGTPGGVSGNATCIATWDDTSLYFSTCPGAGP